MIMPTAAGIKMKFPEFMSQTDAAVEFALEEAALRVGDGSAWVSQANAQLAALYYAAHVLAVSLMTAESGGTGQAVASESITGLGLTTFAVVKSPPACEVEQTAYGRRYLDLVAMNFGGGFQI